MVRILKPGEPFPDRPTPKQMKEVVRDNNHVALCAWIDAQLHKAAWENEKDRRDQLAARIVNGERWLDEHGTGDAQYAEALGLLVMLKTRHRQCIDNMKALASVGWYWCCLTYEAGQRVDPGWDRELNDKASDAPSARAIWDRLWDIEPPDTNPTERTGWPDRQLGTVEVWNLPDMQELARRLAV